MTTDLKTTHTEDGLAHLLEQFQSSDDLRAFLSAFLDQGQEYESALQPLIDARNVHTMTGDRLDGLGKIVNVVRGGRTDDAYRLRLRGELAILKSTGTELDLTSILQLLVGQAQPDIQVDEYFPKTLYMRVRNLDIGDTADGTIMATLMRRAASAATQFHLIFSTAEGDDDNVFRFSDTTDTPETSSTKGFGNGTLDGVA